MKFFRQMYEVLDGDFDLTMTMRKTGPDHITVSVLPNPKKNEEAKDKKVTLQPLILSGSGDDLDQGFLQNMKRIKVETMNVVNTLQGYKQNIQSQLDKNVRKKSKKKTEDKGPGLFNKEDK